MNKILKFNTGTDQKYFENFEMKFWARLEEIRGTVRVKNNEVLHGIINTDIINARKNRSENG